MLRSPPVAGGATPPRGRSPAPEEGIDHLRRGSDDPTSRSRYPVMGIRALRRGRSCSSKRGAGPSQKIPTTLHGGSLPIEGAVIAPAPGVDRRGGGCDDPAIGEPIPSR